jgi:lipopolysaccharide transport system permease protein
MLIFTYLFGKLAGMPMEGTASYSIMVFAGLLPWQFFSSSITESSASLLSNQNLLTKVYFPRLILPASSIVTCFLDFLVSFLILAGLLIYYNYLPPAEIVLLPFLWVLMVLASLGPGLLLTALNVQYRDFRYIIPFIVQLGLFVSPVGLSSLVIPEQWKWIFYLNPMAGIIDAFRYCIIRDSANPFTQPYFYISLAVIFILVIVSIRVFRRMEKSFADLI